MSEQSQRVYITERLETRMKAFDPTLKIALPNLPFDPPEGEVYGRMHIMGGRSLNAAKSGDDILIRRTGILQVTFLTPAESGTKRALAAVDEIARVFENHRGTDESGVQYNFKTAEIRNADLMGGWYPSIIRVPFSRDEYRAMPSIMTT